MQDRYAGDIGDFLKVGLLHSLTAATTSEPALSLGIVWYLTEDESHNADGKHVTYLDPSHPSAARFRNMSPDLYDGLQRMVASGSRSVAGLSPVLPPLTSVYADRLSFAGFAPSERTLRTRHRADWHASAMTAVRGVDVVFVDPDNGVRASDHAQQRHVNGAVKHAYLDEVADYAGRGQTVVVYYHADRSASVPDQARTRMQMMASAVPAPPLAAVRARRGTTRLFMLCPSPRHAARITRRLQALAASPWAGELEPIWFRDDLA